MNNVLELKGKRFVQESKTNRGGGPAMNSKVTVTSSKISKLTEKLSQIKEFWKKEKRPFRGIILSVCYNKIVAKSNRIAGLLKGIDSNFAIVGAKFNKDKNKHIITYFIEMDDLDNSIDLLCKSRDIMVVFFQEGITKTIFDDKKAMEKIDFSKLPLQKTAFKQIIADVSYIEDFEVEFAEQKERESIITLFDTKTDTKQLFKDIGIELLSSRILDNRTVFLDENQIKVLYEKVPYLVSMATENLADLTPAGY